MKKMLVLLLLVPLLLAAKPTRVLVEEAGGFVSVDTSDVRGKFNPHEVWVANVCDTYHEYLPTHGTDSAGPFTFDGTCEVYAWEFPDPTTPISNVLAR